jgi:hypothetical protein
VASSEEAVAVARRLLALPPSEASAEESTGTGSAWRVRRLDGKGVYFLVHVAGQVACIDAASEALLTSAAAARTPVAVSREDALAIAGRDHAASAELVWEASAATLSMFDPLWSVTQEGVVVFVDQRGRVWPALPPKRPGGGPG